MNPILQKILIHSATTAVALLLGFNIFRAIIKAFKKSIAYNILIFFVITTLGLNELTAISGDYRVYARVFLISFSLAAAFSFRKKKQARAKKA